MKNLPSAAETDRSGDKYNFIIQKVMDYRIAKVILVANYFDLFTLIDQGRNTPEKICAKLGANPKALELLLNALVSIQLLKKRKNTYLNTILSKRFLVKGEKNYKGDNLKYQELVWDCWTSLKDVVKSGSPPFTLEELLSKQHPDFVENYIHGMDNIARPAAKAISDILDLSRFKRMLDVGAGSGAYSIHFAKTHPHLQVDILDLPLPLRVTRKLISGAHLRKRIRILEGSYLSCGFDPGYDFIFMSHITHNESDDTNQFLVKKAYDALKPGGTLAIHDFLVAESKTHPRFSAVFSVNLLVYTQHGRTYSWNEYRKWLRNAGFGRMRKFPVLPEFENSSFLLIAEKPE